MSRVNEETVHREGQVITEGDPRIGLDWRLRLGPVLGTLEQDLLMGSVMECYRKPQMESLIVTDWSGDASLGTSLDWFWGSMLSYSLYQRLRLRSDPF